MEKEKHPVQCPVDMTSLSEKELDAELEKGYADMLNGRVKSVGKVFEDIRKDFNLTK